MTTAIRPPVETFRMMQDLLHHAKRMGLEPHLFMYGFFTRCSIMRSPGMKDLPASEQIELFGLPCATTSFDGALALCCICPNHPEAHSLLIYDKDL